MTTEKSTDDILMEFMDQTEDVNSKETTAVSEPKNENQTSEDLLNASSEKDSEFWTSVQDKFFKSGKFTPFLKEGAEKEDDYAFPTNFDEFDEVIQANITQRIEESRYNDQEALLSDVFSKTTPAFQFLAQQANNFTTPEELLPLIQSVQQQDQLAQLDLDDLEHQEFIVRQGMAMQGFDTEAIDRDIEDLKDENKLKKWAEKYKPSLDKIQADRTEQIVQAQLEENNKQKQFLNGFLQNLQTDLLDAPDLDGMNLTSDDRLKVAYNLFPEENVGAPLYNKIDELFGAQDIKKLALISMIVEDKDGMFDSYYASKTHTKAGKELGRKLATGMTFKTTQEDFKENSNQDRNTEMDPQKYGSFL